MGVRVPHRMSLTPRLDLRGGRDCWRDDAKAYPSADALPGGDVDVAIIGAGVTGAVLADRLCAQGRRVVVLDRRRPATGSTAASTALVLWAPDVPLVEHVQRFGPEGANARWRAVFEAVQGLDRRGQALGLDCGWLGRPDVYLAGERLNAEGLRREADARQAAGLPCEWLDGPDVAHRFGVAADAALVSAGAYAADPVALTRGLLSAAQAAGAHLVFPVDVTDLAERPEDVIVTLDDRRRLVARHVILATGYEAHMPRGFSLGSSFAIASPPGQAAAWREHAMIWEASDPYLYFRTTPDGRVVVGGEDEAFAEPTRRDALIPAKAARLAAKVRKRLPHLDLTADCAWAATFGSSADGLPAIGRRGDGARTFVAHSFGGNGIAFAALAADLLAGELAGEPVDTAPLFRPDRFAGSGSE